MSLRHHPTDETIMGYASGALSEGCAVVVATHLGLCPDCAAKVTTTEAIGGALLEDLPASDIADTALASIMARLDEPVPLAAEMAASEWPTPLRRYAVGKWRWLAPGIRLISILKGSPAKAGLQLLRIAPGIAMPLHGHRGLEITCVLAGGFTDATGSYGPGDVAELDGAIHHQPVADAGEDCICLIAIEDRLRFTSPIARLVQIFTGI